MSAPIPQNCTWVGGVSPADTPNPADRQADLLEKHPEIAPYTWPASAGDVREVVKRLEEVSADLKKLHGLLERFIQNGGGR